MTAFAERTGLEREGPGRRYLWTDSFAVSNFLGLARATGEARHSRMALLLVDRVHHVLGRHRPDDDRTGWLSGLSESEGEAHPTAGGLRIGKKWPERREDEPFDEDLEWERDGQYFHYLTRWMHALSQTARATGRTTLGTWAGELGRAAHAAFVWTAPDGRGRRMYWKMSIDLSRPLVPSMGHHDALDGHVACLEAEAAAAALPGAEGPSLLAEARRFASMIDRRRLASPDPLGLGGLLTSAFLLDRLAREGRPADPTLGEAVLAGAQEGLEVYSQQAPRHLPAERRLAFRELGLAIGLEAAALMSETPPASPRQRALLETIGEKTGLADQIRSFWLEDQHRTGAAWREHQDINEVMLATALAPEGFLSL